MAIWSWNVTSPDDLYNRAARRVRRLSDALLGYAQALERHGHNCVEMNQVAADLELQIHQLTGQIAAGHLLAGFRSIDRYPSSFTRHHAQNPRDAWRGPADPLEQDFSGLTCGAFVIAAEIQRKRIPGFIENLDQLGELCGLIFA